MAQFAGVGEACWSATSTLLPSTAADTPSFSLIQAAMSGVISTCSRLKLVEIGFAKGAEDVTVCGANLLGGEPRDLAPALQ
jgi:hypothetical protein